VRSAGRCSATGSPSASTAAPLCAGSSSSSATCLRSALSAAASCCAGARRAQRRSARCSPSTARPAASPFALRTCSARRSVAASTRRRNRPQATPPRWNATGFQGGDRHADMAAHKPAVCSENRRAVTHSAHFRDTFVCVPGTGGVPSHHVARRRCRTGGLAPLADLGEADDRDGVVRRHVAVVELAEEGGHVLSAADLRIVVLDLAR
jgi:hypothetical protein